MLKLVKVVKSILKHPLFSIFNSVFQYAGRSMGMCNCTLSSYNRQRYGSVCLQDVELSPYEQRPQAYGVLPKERMSLHNI